MSAFVLLRKPQQAPSLTRVSIPVDLAALAERIEEFGPVAYLMSVNPDGVPHVVSVRVGWESEHLEVGAGRRTSANVEEHPEVTLLWPAGPGAAYCLIVDGTARPRAGAAEPTLGIEPTAAVLHRTPEGDPSSPSCITVLPRA
jgi:hypothetical protein